MFLKHIATIFHSEAWLGMFPAYKLMGAAGLT